MGRDPGIPGFGIPGLKTLNGITHAINGKYNLSSNAMIYWRVIVDERSKPVMASTILFILYRQNKTH